MGQEPEGRGQQEQQRGLQGPGAAVAPRVAGLVVLVAAAVQIEGSGGRRGARRARCRATVVVRGLASPEW
jgi:hypothetical protein